MIYLLTSDSSTLAMWDVLYIQKQENELRFQEDEGGTSFGVSSVKLGLFRSISASEMFYSNKLLQAIRRHSTVLNSQRGKKLRFAEYIPVF
jgi:hypothetical protein